MVILRLLKILQFLLLIIHTVNHKIHEEEVVAGLWDKKKTLKKEKVVKNKGNVVNEPGETYGQGELFNH